MSSQKVSPSLYSQVGMMVTTMDPDNTFDDDITKICLLAQQYSKESSNTLFKPRLESLGLST